MGAHDRQEGPLGAAPRKLGKGTFTIRVRAVDGAGNVQRGFPAGSTRTLKLTRK